MIARLVYDGGAVHVPEELGTPRHDQMTGTPAEKLIEVAGRTCYDSMGTGRPSGEYHDNLLNTQKHYSVAEHFHATIETGLHYHPWLGIQDIAVRITPIGLTRITFNLRHCLEWPNNVTFCDESPYTEQCMKRWGNLLKEVASILCPNVFPTYPSGEDFQIVEPEHDTEAHISLFLEDSLVWSLEQNRHRFNISQRSGRFVDQTDREYRIHPDFEEFLNECGFLKNDEPDIDSHDYVEYYRSRVNLAEHSRPPRKKGDSEEPLFEGSDLDEQEVQRRTRIGSAVGSLLAQSRIVYKNVVDALEPWLAKKKGLNSRDARKQARSAARYYLGQGLSTEKVFTASVRNWRHIFGMRCSPHADRTIRDLMEKARELVNGSRYGHLL